MAKEEAEPLPDELERWLDAKADELGVDRRVVLARAVEGYRLLEANGEALDVEETAGEDLDALSEEVAGVEDRVDELDGEVERVESEFWDKIQDVRERVVQVKREADEKAPAGHEHPSLRDDVDRAVAAVDEMQSSLDSVDERIDRGFENYEEILEYLTDTAETLDGKVTTLARTIVDLRSRLADVEAAAHRRAAVDDLKTSANRKGVSTAKCEECRGTVRIGQLTAPTCPHCESTFASVEPSSTFLGSDTLTVGTRPALDGETEAVDSAADLFEDGLEEAASDSSGESGAEHASPTELLFEDEEDAPTASTRELKEIDQAIDRNRGDEES